MTDEEIIIQRTQKWITEVVVGCNFCPFAAKEVMNDTIDYKVEIGVSLEQSLQAFLHACIRLDQNEGISTGFVIFPNAFAKFDDYLDVVSLAEQLLTQEGYEGIYQVASFHPLYRFADAPPDDPANFTNRSIYPMIQLLREESVEQALARYADPASIPERNILFTRNKGLTFMQMLRDACLR